MSARMRCSDAFPDSFPLRLVIQGTSTLSLLLVVCAIALFGMVCLLAAFFPCVTL